MNKIKLIINNDIKKIEKESFFFKKELQCILNLYAKMVSNGSWKDYSFSTGAKEVSFDVYQRTSEKPVLRITKNLKPNYYEKATGITYTKTGERSVSPEMIRNNIDELYECAKNNPDKKFFVAYMNNSKNLNGYSPKEMWDMFTEGKTVPDNIRFHESFRVFMPQQNITQAGQRKREGIAKLSEAYNIAKETGNVRTKQIKNGIISR